MDTMDTLAIEDKVTLVGTIIGVYADYPLMAYEVRLENGQEITVMHDNKTMTKTN